MLFIMDIFVNPQLNKLLSLALEMMHDCCKKKILLP